MSQHQQQQQTIAAILCRSPNNRRKTIRHSQWESKAAGQSTTIFAKSWMIVLALLFLGLPVFLFAEIEVEQKVVHHNKGDHHHQLQHHLRENVHPSQIPKVDAIVVGSGLAGMTATLRILDRGGSVIMIEKESILGGNSNKASSGINACCLERDEKFNDTIAEFLQDTLQSAGPHANIALIETLVDHSAAAVNWLYNRVGIDLSQLVLLGGHSKPRTHRPQFGFVGAEIMSAIEAAIYNYRATGRINVMLNTQVLKLLHDEYDHNQVRGVQIRKLHDKHHLKPLNLYANDVILATGGFASDRSRGSLLEKYRPDLISLGATAGNFSTGDGIVMAEALGAMTLDMEKVQIHPTGFVDPQQPDNPNKVLAAELLRGVGGILLNRDGQRFCNELGRRNYVVDKMMNQKERSGEPQRRLGQRQSGHTFFLVLPSGSANEAKSHISHYLYQRLMTEVSGVQGLSERIGVSRDVVEKTLRQYQTHAVTGKADEHGKTVFSGFPLVNFDTETFLVGEVTPVLHYCMGGIGIDAAGHVLNENGERIWGLHAAGEVTGGVHGNNRLGGNSLLECAVFGSIVGESIPIVERHYDSHNGENQEVAHPLDSAIFQNPLLPVITEAELSRHNTANDSWVAIHGHVYDLTSFLPEHPGGIDSVASLSGMDGTDVFAALHSRRILDRLESQIVGRLDASAEFDLNKNTNNANVNTKHPEENLSLDTVWLHNSETDCWICIHGNVFDVTIFAKTHPGGSHMIHKHCGKDATLEFEVFHKKGIQLLNGIEHLRLGELSMW